MNIQNMISAAAQALLDNSQDIAFDFSASTGDFVVVGFEAREAVNEPFEIEIELASKDADIDLHALMDTDATLGIYDKYQIPRFLSGVITEVERADQGMHRTFYSVTLRPAIHRLAHISDSRIWQQKSVVDIVTELLAENNIPNTEWRLAESHEPREYATCYNEDLLSLTHRLLAEEGIFYFFEHNADGHKLIFTDAPLTTPELKAAPMIAYNANTGGTAKGSFISSFSQREKLRSSTYEINDYTFKNPPANFKQKRGGQETNGLGQDYALYQAPARYKDPDAVGKNFAKHRIESVRVDATTGKGKTNNIHLCAGYHFSIAEHDDMKANGSHFLLSVTHSGTQPAALEEEAGDNPTTYNAGFTTMPARLPYRPKLAPKPTIDGPQIAHVTGPAGEEIYCDEHGRVKVWFPWDRHGKQDESSSCWVRVMHASSGQRYGHMTIPRIGSEVVISHLDGDIDQPMVIGMAYNPTKQHAYDLPEHKTRSSWKDKTHKGTFNEFNEIRFESEKGREEIFVHAQKDVTEKIRNNRATRIDMNSVTSIGSNQYVKVSKDSTQSIGKNFTLNVGSSRVDPISAIGKGESPNKIRSTGYYVGATLPENTGRGNFSLNAAGNVNFSTNKSISQDMDKSNYLNIGKNAITNIGGNLRETVSGKVSQVVGKNLTVDAHGKITLRSGASKIELAPDGTITIEGTHIITKAGRIDLN